jgi:hypothetical protein
MKLVRTLVIGIAAAGALSLGLGSALAAVPGAGACWSSAQVSSAIAEGTIKSWAKIRRIAGIPDDLYETSPVQVCMLDGVPYFIVNMSSPKGENVKIVRNAIDGSD